MQSPNTHKARDQSLAITNIICMIIHTLPSISHPQPGATPPPPNEMSPAGAKLLQESGEIYIGPTAITT